YMMASGVAILNMYLGIHIRSLGSGTDVVGTAFAVSAMSELPVIGFGTLIMSRIGARRMIIIALVAYIVRFSMLAVAPDAGWVIASQLLHGLSFAMFLVASVNLAHRLVGGELAATAQALLGTMSFGFGNITGSLVGGALLDVLGTRTLYSGVVLLMAAALAVYVIGGRLLSAERYEPASERPASG
ncbi:MAG TPA: MFS transporter, partial [Thermomicrobiales bacterium]|nr:MFS transporter [Thermomicrobiales bacterium]